MKLKTLCAAGALLLWAGDAVADCSLNISPQEHQDQQRLFSIELEANGKKYVHNRAGYANIGNIIKKVTSLHIHGKMDQEQFENLLKRANNLEELTVQNWDFTEVPEAIFGLTNLKTLNITNCNISSLPENIAQLTDLRFLTLSNNRLKTLPESISKLKNLKYLSIDRNEIDTLPEEMAKMNLDTLDIHWQRSSINYDSANAVVLTKDSSTARAIANPRLRMLIIDSNGTGPRNLHSDKLSEVRKRTLNDTLLKERQKNEALLKEKQKQEALLREKQKQEALLKEKQKQEALLKSKLKSLSEKELELAEIEQNILNQLEFLRKERQRLKNIGDSKKADEAYNKVLKKIQKKREFVQNQIGNVQSSLNKIKH